MAEHGYDIGDFKIHYLKDDGNGARMEPRHWVPYVSWDELNGWEHYDELSRWMRGKTCVERGVYPWDLQSFMGIMKRRKARQ